jgi:hemoglobin
MRRDELDMASGSLYDRLGQAGGIGRLVDKVMAAHLANPVVAPRFQSLKDLDHAKKMVCDFFCAGAGGPQQYAGKDMLSAHRGMNISEQEYLAVTDDIMGALQSEQIDAATQKDVLAIIYALKGDIIHR